MQVRIIHRHLVAAVMVLVGGQDQSVPSPKLGSCASNMVRILRPGMSSKMGTSGRTSRSRVMVLRCHSRSLCDPLRRATDMPAFFKALSDSGLQVAGPMVATILE